MQPPAWWRIRIAEAAAGRPGVRYRRMLADVTGQYDKNDPFAGRIGEEIIAG